MILVTGGAGFIGSNLLARLTMEGRRVSINDTLGSGDKWRNVSRHPVDELVSPDGLDDFLERRAEEIELIYHLGAITSTTETDAELLAETNVRLSQRLWRWCARNQVPLVYASSAATYGDGVRGFRDEDTEDALAALHPLNAYAWSKHAFDRWAVGEAAAGRARPPLWYGLKLFNVYGPNEYHKGEMQSVVAKAYAQASCGNPVTLFRSHNPAYADGGQKRDFIHVDDCVDVLLWLAASHPPSGLYNVGTGRAQTWLELVEAVYAALGRTAEIRWIDVPEALRARYQYYTQADVSKLRAAGYHGAFRPLEEGVPQYVRDYLATSDPYR
ncbi:MAG: ADP-glyceromanno-heptose 6-epimerase [Gemmatimonadales bacterium]